MGLSKGGIARADWPIWVRRLHLLLEVEEEWTRWDEGGRVGAEPRALTAAEVAEIARIIRRWVLGQMRATLL